jgi:hypothetical protein
MGQKLAMGSLCALLLALVGLYVADFSGGIPFVTPRAAPTTAPYVEAIGTPAPVELPEVDMSTWFVEPEPSGGEEAVEGGVGAEEAAGEGESTVPGFDPYDPAKWQQIAGFLDHVRSQSGWTEGCAVATTAAGADRTASPLVGALACSDIASVTLVQQFAAGVLGAQAELALWIRGVPGRSPAGVEARQGELRLMCSVDVIAREGGEESTYAEACALALDAAYRAGDGPASFEAFGAAYALAAADIAARDATTDPEPGWYTVVTEES